MPRVLIVEDSPDQALLITRLLESAGYSAEVAADAGAALARIERDPPDLVATDLVMPGMDGLELVEKVRAGYPYVPVVLMTAVGTGEIAVEALRRGAASYVHKGRLFEDLLPTVEKTLELAREKREQERVHECLEQSTLTYRLENDQSLVVPLVSHIQESIKAIRPALDEGQLMQIGVALQEALLNAMHHGNLEVSSELRHDGSESYHRTIEERLREPRYADRRVRLSVRLSRERLECEVLDEGPGFDLAQVPDPTDPENLLKASGRGLYLILAFMDEVSHNETGSEIRMAKRFPVAAKA